MKKIILIIVVLTFSLNTFAQQRDESGEARSGRENQANFLPISENNKDDEEPGVSTAACDLNNQGVEKTLKERNYELATELFRKAVEADAGCLKCRYNLGMSLINLEKFEESAQVFAGLLSIKPDYAQGYSGLGEALTKKGLFKESAAAYLKAAEITPNDPVVLTNLGNALYRIKSNQQALVYLDKAVKLNPDMAGAHSNRGTVLYAVGRPKEAIESLRRAVALEPDVAETQNNLGVALDSLGKRKEAQAHFLEALRLRPNWKMALYNLSLSYFESGNQTAARQYLRKLEETDSEMAKEAFRIISARYVLQAASLR
jgi:tetratricopeptide (TPR) repeat protein